MSPLPPPQGRSNRLTVAAPRIEPRPRFTPALALLLQRLDGLPPGPALKDLMRVVAEVPVSTGDVQAYIRFAQDEYQSIPIHVSTHYEVCCLCWGSGHASVVHDHPGSCCCVRVLQGVLTNTNFEWSPGNRSFTTRTFPVAVGGLLGLYDRQAHRVSNDQPSGHGLITLHVYAPPRGDGADGNSPSIPQASDNK